MKKKLVLGLGSNLGNRYAHIMQAVWMLETKIGELATKAYFYETPPWGDTNQARYINTVIAFDTDKSIEQCFALVQATEKEMGRERIRRWGPRNIDVDILLLGDEIVETETLEVPHRELTNRAFVMVPLCDILPDMEHPIALKTMKHLVKHIEDNTTLFTG